MVAIEKLLIFRATFMFLKWKFREFLWNQIFSFLEVSLICYNIVTSCLLPSNYSVSPGPPAACCPAPWWLWFFNFDIDTVLNAYYLAIGYWFSTLKLGHLSEKPLLMSSFVNKPPVSEDIEDKYSHSGKGAFSEYCVFIPTQHQCQNWGTLPWWCLF